MQGEDQASDGHFDQNAAMEFRTEESLLRALDQWSGDEFEAERHCVRAITRVRAICDTESETSTDRDKKSQERTTRSRIGPYQLLGFIGRGGMGRVFKARHERLGREVALKVLSTSSTRRAHTTKRFQREMRALGRIDHPNIVAASDAGVRDGIDFLAMEFVDGVSFAEILNHEGSLDIADACELMRQTAVALAAAHQIGMVHRDIKPSNLMLAMDGSGIPRVKVLDFGLALFRDESERTDELTQSGQVVGTFEYMAPEQCLNSHTVDHRADLYSIGSTIAKLLCHGRSSQKTQEELTPLQRILRRVEEPLPSIATRRSGLSDDLVRLIDQLLSGDPEQRPDSAEVTAERLRPHCAEHRLDELLRRVPRRPLDTSCDYLTMVAPTSAVTTPRPHLRWLAWMGAALLVMFAWVLGMNGGHGKRGIPTLNASNQEESRPSVKDFFDEKRWELSSSLVGYWPVSDNPVRLIDRSGNGQHLELEVLHGSAISHEQAPGGGVHSLQISQLQRPVMITPDPHVKGAHSIAFWFRAEVGGPHSQRILAQADGANGFEMRLGNNRSVFPGRFVFRMSSSESDGPVLAANASFKKRAWHHVAIVNHQDSSSLYVDGTLDRSFDTRLIDFSKPLELGGEPSPMTMELDEIALFERELTENEIRKLTATRLTPRPLFGEGNITRVAETQQAWADHLRLPTRWTNSLGMQFSLIPPGEFLMGSPQEVIEQEIAGDGRKAYWDRYRSEGPQHRVRITRPFFLGCHEVTQQQYEEVTGANPSYFQSTGKGRQWIGDVDTNTLPVECVSWLDTIDFCQRLSRRENLPVAYRESDESFERIGTGYRLPTEAEWEFACRAGTLTRWFCDPRRLQEYGHWVRNSPRRPSPVGTRLPNALGLFDIHGNVFEWCFDYYDTDHYANEPELSIDPAGPASGLRRVYRSGSWWQRKSQSRSAFRGHHFPSFDHQEHGIRVLIPVESVARSLRAANGGSLSAEARIVSR